MSVEGRVCVTVPDEGWFVFGVLAICSVVGLTEPTPPGVALVTVAVSVRSKSLVTVH